MSTNCLITRLKAVVNDDSLPVIETMKQFTLDAITASGNNNMTDEQKWALNRFFTRIGADNNSGIFAKTKFMFLPIICNENLSTAMYDYKNAVSHTIVDNSVIFRDNGLISTSEGTSAINLLGNTELGFEGSTSNLYIAVGLSQTINQQIPVQTLCKTKVESGFEKDNLFIGSYAAFTWNNQVRIRRNGITSAYGSVFTKDNNNYHGRFINYTDSEFTITPVSENPSADIQGTVNIIPCAGYASQVPTGIYMFGTALTDTECNILSNAIMDLITAFSA